MLLQKAYSLAMAAMMYEAIESEKLPCLYVHHNLEFPGNLEYLAEMKDRGFAVELVNPFLNYFELTDRGIRHTAKSITLRYVSGITVMSRSCFSKAG